MDKIKVSVIIPVYNEPELVIRALESIPERKDIEIIVIDDCSTDDTWSQIFQWAVGASPKNFSLSSNEENLGVGMTVNKGYDEAKGEYVVLLGADDCFIPARFEQAMNELDGTDLVYFNLQIRDGSIFKLTEGTKYKYCGSTKFMRREFIGDTRNPNKRVREDWDFYQELMEKNPTEKFTGITMKYYNYPREGSLTWQVCHEEEK